MKALSVKQPWAYCICAGIPQMKHVNNPDGSKRVELTGMAYIKDVENRDWATDFRGRVYIHAGKSFDNDAEIALMKMGFSPIIVMSLFSKLVFRGGIIGEVEITNCVTESESPWFTGKYGFTLANPILYEKPISCRGKLGFFDLPPEIEQAISEMKKS